MAAQIHIQLKDLTVKDKARIAKLSDVEKEELKGQIMVTFLEKERGMKRARAPGSVFCTVVCSTCLYMQELSSN
jgi:hypothetical protein